MVHCVGIAGVNGNVGKPAVQELAKAAAGGKIKLVIFHRTNAPLKDAFPGENVEFRTLNYDDPIQPIQEAVEGINVFICALGSGALKHEPKLVEALLKSTDIVTYIPSVYSTTWRPEDFVDPNLSPVLKFLHAGWDKAKEVGIGVTPIFTGVFDLTLFAQGFMGSALKANMIWANGEQMANRFPITTLDHLGRAIAKIATEEPHVVKNREYSVVTFWPTGNELLELYTKINGAQAQVKDFTAADRVSQLADAANSGPAKVGYWDRWTTGEWDYEKDGKMIIEDDRTVSLEEVAEKFR